MHSSISKKSDVWNVWIVWVVAFAALLLVDSCTCNESPRGTVDSPRTDNSLGADSDYQRKDFKLVPESLLANHNGQDAYTPAVAFGNGTFLVSWQSGRVAEGDLCSNSPDFIGSIVGARLDKAGKVLDKTPFVISDAADLQERPAIAFGGGVFVVVWQDLRNGKDWDIYAARVGSDGKVLDPGGILLAGRARSQGAPKIAWDGQTFVVVWMDNFAGQYQVFAARLTADGEVKDPNGFKVSTRDAASDKRSSIFPTIASSGGKSFVLWLVATTGYGGRISWADGSLVSNGKAQFVFEYTMKDWNATGRALGPGKNSIPIDLAASGNGYLLAWSTNKQKALEKSNCSLFGLDGKRSNDLRTLSNQPQMIIAPKVAWDGSSFVAAWTTQQNPGGVHDRVKASRLGADGKPSGTVHAIAGVPDAPAKLPDVASDGSGTTCIVYEKHPIDAKTPIAIGFRLFGSGDK